MELKELTLSAIDALYSNLLRTSLTMLGMIIGISAVILIVSLGQGAVSFITNEFTSFGTDYFQINPGTSQISTIAGADTLTQEDLEAIKTDTSLTNIKEVVPNAMSAEKITANDVEESPLVYGVTSNIVSILRPEIVYGDFITAEQEASKARVVVMGQDIAKTFFGENTSPIGETVKIRSKKFRVIGVIKSSSVLAGSFFNNAIFIPYEVMTNEILGEEKLQEIDISVKDTQALNQTMKDVEELLREKHGLKEGDKNDFQMSSAKDIISTVQTITNLLITLIAAISGISLVVGGVGIMNIMLVSVTERTKEIGLLKSIGARKRDILIQFLVESVVMSLIGGSVGIFVGITLAFIISLIVNIPFIINVFSIIIAVGVSTLIGIIFGLYPARRAANLSPIEALRHE